MRYERHAPNGDYIGDQGNPPWDISRPFPDKTKWPAAHLLYCAWYWEFKCMDDHWASCLQMIKRDHPAVYG